MVCVFISQLEMKEARPTCGKTGFNTNDSNEDSVLKVHQLQSPGSPWAWVKKKTPFLDFMNF